MMCVMVVVRVVLGGDVSYGGGGVVLGLKG